jgi:hypothetical protein
MANPKLTNIVKFLSIHIIEHILIESCILQSNESWGRPYGTLSIDAQGHQINFLTNFQCLYRMIHCHHMPFAL